MTSRRQGELPATRGSGERWTKREERLYEENASLRSSLQTWMFRSWVLLLFADRLLAAALAERAEEAA